MTTITQDQVDEACEAYKNAIGNALGDSADAMRKVLEKFVGSGSRESAEPRDTKDGKYPPFDHMQTAGVPDGWREALLAGKQYALEVLQQQGDSYAGYESLSRMDSIGEDIRAIDAVLAAAPPPPDAGVPDGFLAHVRDVCFAAEDLCEPKPRRNLGDSREHDGAACLAELTSIANGIDRILAAIPPAPAQAATPDERVTPEMMHELESHLPFAIRTPSDRWDWQAKRMNEMLAHPNKPCPTCGQAWEGNLAKDESNA